MSDHNRYVDIGYTMTLKKLKNKIKKDVYQNHLQDKLISALVNLNKPYSAIFYTTHKCASTFVYRLFDVILKNSEYEFVDYASAIYKSGDKLNIEIPYEGFLEQAYSELYSLWLRKQILFRMLK